MKNERISRKDIKKIIFIIMLLFVTSCNMEKYCATHYPPVISNDSTSNTETSYTRHDSIITIPADSSWLKMYLECNKDGQVIAKQLDSYKSGKNVQLPKVIIKNNILQAECKVDTNKIGIYWFNKYVKTNVKVKQVAVKEIYKTTKFQSFLNISGWILWGIILLGIIITLLKIFIKFKVI